MEIRTLKFLLFIVFSLACFAAGYVARKRGWAKPEWSRPMHHFTLVWLWSPVSLLSFWGLPMQGEAAADLALLMLSQPVLMIGAAGVMIALAMVLRRPRSDRGPLILAAALSNHGFTLGAYLCYALLTPADTALRYGIAYVTSMQVFMVLLLYPVAYHYGPHQGTTLGQLIIGSFFTRRAMPLYMAGLGAGLQLAGVAMPGWIDRYSVMDVLFFLGAAGSYGGIGLLVRFADTWRALPLHGMLAAVQFGAYPLLTAGLLALLNMGGVSMGMLPQQVMWLESFTPAALNAVMVANLFHLDARLASVLWLWNTLAFCFGPLVVLLLMYS